MQKTINIQAKTLSDIRATLQTAINVIDNLQKKPKKLTPAQVRKLKVQEIMKKL